MIRIVTAILLVAAFARIHDGTRDIRFHSDEALYSAYARNAAVHGKWGLDGPLDKPPLSIYASALGMHFFGSEITPDNVIDVPIIRGEFAAKLPNIFAGLITVALIFSLTRTLYQRDHSVALMAMLIAAVSPYMIAYSSSAFTDALMLLFMTAAVVMAARSRPSICGALFALSVAAKPQGILYIPLAIGFLWLADIQARRFFDKFWRDTGKLGITLAGGVAILLAWDMMRPETSIFTLGAVNISQGRTFAPVGDWGSRLSDWLEHGGDLLGSAWFTAALAIAGVIPPLIRRHKTDLILLVYVLGFFALHWIGAFFTFDRYLLPLVPPMAMLSARGVVWGMSQIRISETTRLGYAYGLISIVIVILGLTGYHDPRADSYHGESEQGILEFAAYIHDKPPGAIIYDRWLGWEMSYYLGAWNDKRSVYYPEPANLATDALLNPDRAPRYLIAPATQDVDDWLDSLARNGFEITLDYARDGYVSYEIIPPAGDEGA